MAPADPHLGERAKRRADSNPSPAVPTGLERPEAYK